MNTLDTKAAPAGSRDKKECWVAEKGNRIAVFFSPDLRGTHYPLPPGEVEARLFDLEHRKGFTIHQAS
jgi:hypothetical protein